MHHNKKMFKSFSIFWCDVSRVCDGVAHGQPERGGSLFGSEVRGRHAGLNSLGLPASGASAAGHEPTMRVRS